MNTQSILTALAASAALSLAGAQSASAQDRASGAETISVKVSYGDLNLASEAGAKVMLRRIRNASKTICGEPASSLDSWSLFRSCVDQTTDRAVAAFDHPMVTAMNGGRRPVAIKLASTRP